MTLIFNLQQYYACKHKDMDVQVLLVSTIYIYLHNNFNMIQLICHFSSSRPKSIDGTDVHVWVQT